MVKLTIINPSFETLSLPNGMIIPKKGLLADKIDKKLAKTLAGIVLIEEIDEKKVEEVAAAKAAMASEGYCYEGEGSMRVVGIKGEFLANIPRFDLTPEEMQLAATTAGVLTKVKTTLN